MGLKSLVSELRLYGIKDEKVLRAMSKIDRKWFVLDRYKDVAYGDYALPLMKGQTISQPFTVAFMLEKLELKKGDSVLEIGTGSGYNACLIAEIVKPGKVYTTEIIKELIEFSKKNIKKSKLKNIEVIEKDGSKGLKRKFDKIVFTAGSEEVPKNLFKDLKKNGILLVPVGKGIQKMMKFKKNKKIEEEDLGDFVFVPVKH
ncbi:protein-L-isoaspartate O-methyltransferase [archaeon]|nr:protein-L-isoaspartate O-methyltransferase [archaeon]|tara:strand:- start:741 stop:1343 length:603 start_codon:yes stop_codon:yes gene_type:complete